MEDIFIFIWVVLPITIGMVVIAIIWAVTQAYKARISFINRRSFEELADKLKEENTKIITELAVMKESLNVLLAEYNRTE